PNFTNL
ncbi:hypothetical protein D021_1913B, partial [Vibrio parahaemolyticus 10296]